MNLENLLPSFMGLFENKIYSYTDGSNNSYYLSKDQIEYDPISPMMSNTGEYSGGSPAKESLTKEQLNEAKVVFEQAAADTNNHLENRPKGSGTVKIHETGHIFVLRMGAASKSNIENLLKKLLKR